MAMLPTQLILRLEGGFGQQGPRGWSINLPAELEPLTDNHRAAHRSPLILLEDDKPLGKGHHLHELIFEEGGGRYSFWNGNLFFPTSDNSDPNSNGRTYSVVRTDADIWERAQAYVANTGEDYYMNGILQVELLKQNGLQPHHNVLEIGCGPLAAGRLLIQRLDADRYVGIEPNLWLIDAARHRFPDAAEMFLSKRPIFLTRTDFDASETGRRFDFILSHSILSHSILTHVAHAQLGQFLAACKKVLQPTGMVVASINFRDRRGARVGDSLHSEWQYPGGSNFAFETVKTVAEAQGLEVEERDTLFARHEPDRDGLVQAQDIAAPSPGTDPRWPVATHRRLARPAHPRRMRQLSPSCRLWRLKLKMLIAAARHLEAALGQAKPGSLGAR